MKIRRPTVADLKAMKGKRQLTMLRVVTLEEAEAAEKAGVDLVSVPPALLGPAFRRRRRLSLPFRGWNTAISSRRTTICAAPSRR